MCVPMDLRVAWMVELMHQEKYRRDPTISWRQAFLGAESGGYESMGVVNWGWLESYWGAIHT